MTKFKSVIIAPALAFLLTTSLNAEQFSITNLSLKQAIEEISKKSNMPYMVDGKLLEGKKAPNINNIEGVENALNEILKGSGLEATIENKTILISPTQGAIKVINGTYILDEVSVKEGMENSYTRTQDNSATGMNLSLKETPQSVSVITSKRMEDQQLNNLVDVLKNTTGVTSNGEARDIFVSRGYKIKNYQVDGAPIAYYSDTSYESYNTDTAIYDSISVVRGATGLLTGAGDPSGSINLVRKKPTKDFQASLEAQTGRWDKYRGVVDVSGGFNEDGSIRGRFIAVNDQGGYFNPLAEKERTTLYGVVEADLGDATTIAGSYERTEMENNGHYMINVGARRFLYNQNWNIVSLSNFDKYTWHATDWTDHKQIRDNYTLNLEHHINDSWKIDTSYSYIEEDASHKIGSCFTWRADGCQLFENNKSQVDSKIHSIDTKLTGNFELWGQTHDLMMGFNGVKTKFDIKAFNKSNTNLQDIKMINNRVVVSEPIWGEVSSIRENKTTQYGGFISTRLKITDDLSAILGSRYSKWETEGYFKGIINDDRKFNNFLPYLALTYDITDNLTTYVSYTEIFNPQNTKDRDDKFLDPETGFNYEVGLKGEWFDGRLNSSIALFQSGKDNLAVTDYINGNSGECHRTSTGGCASKALDDTKNKGWEFEVVGEITPYWQAQFGFSSSILKDSDGKRLNHSTIPVRTANLFTTYQPTAQLTLGGGVRWQSETYDNAVKNTYINIGREDLAGEAKQDDFFVVDLMANYEFNKNLSLLVNINNALNKEYKTSFETYSYGEERNWMATLKYKF
ncbi:TonB-dependent siderophore receptor [Aliarcobacter lanthieri]|uniref:TonB-dependent siderophore receptor n=1 Tax=Aliarcobacter lanthieri TaxID=1355374 RepID=UPI003AACC1AD